MINFRGWIGGFKIYHFMLFTTKYTNLVYSSSVIQSNLKLILYKYYLSSLINSNASYWILNFYYWYMENSTKGLSHLLSSGYNKQKYSEAEILEGVLNQHNNMFNYIYKYYFPGIRTMVYAFHSLVLNAEDVPNVMRILK